MAGRVPAAAVLLVERDELAGRVDACRPTRVGEQQQREQAGGLRVVGQQLVQHPRDLQRAIGEIGAHQRLVRDAATWPAL